MTQISGPIANQTFTDAQWRYIHGSEAGIVGDINGSSYAYELSTNSDAFVVGSTTQDSISVVAGFLHGILAGQSQSVTIPAPVTATRTDVVVVRYDPTYVPDVPNVGDTAPCRLAVVSGTEGAGVPAHDATPPGAEDLPLFNVTRAVGQSLAQATVRDRRTRTSISLLVPTVTDVPTDAPLATRVHVEATGDDYTRVLNAQKIPTWAVRRRSVYATASGIAEFPEFLAAAHIGSVTFPTGLFTVPPVVTVSVVSATESVNVVANAHGVTAGGFKPTMSSTNGQAFVSTNRRVHWTATQATATSATG